MIIKVDPPYKMEHKANNDTHLKKGLEKKKRCLLQLDIKIPEILKCIIIILWII